ncbi:hypothetical protein Tco_0115071 [Tanacetum coccineum]
MKAQKKVSSDGGPINMGSPYSVQAAPKAIMGMPPVSTPRSEKSVSFQKSIFGPRPKHIIVNNVKVLVASDNEGQICDNKCRVTFSEHDSEITKDGKIIDYLHGLRVCRQKGYAVLGIGQHVFLVKVLALCGNADISFVVGYEHIGQNQ